MPEISVIIPLLNSGKYLSAALESLIAQKFQDFEVLLVDSHSADDTEAICRAWEARNSRFRYLQCSDPLPGAKRNLAMTQARGAYYAFVDSDDIAKPDMLLKLHAAAKKSGADIAVCDLRRIYPDHTVEAFSHMRDEILGKVDPVQYCFSCLCATKPNTFMCTRLYRAQFIRETGLAIINTPRGEDHLYNLMLSLEDPFIVHISDSLYDYIQREDSIIGSSMRSPLLGQSFLSMFHTECDYVEKRRPDLTIPLLGAYAYTRVKSLLFFGRHTGANDSIVKGCIEDFLTEDVRAILRGFLEQGFLSEYCQSNRMDEKQASAARAMLEDCVGGRIPFITPDLLL